MNQDSIIYGGDQPQLKKSGFKPAQQIEVLRIMVNLIIKFYYLLLIIWYNNFKG